MDNRCFMGGVVDWDDSVDAMTVYNLLLNDGLSNVMNVVVNVLVDFLAKVNNGAFLAAVNFRVFMLGS